MTGRVCPVHGEYSAIGVCRWCEPEAVWNPVWPLYRPTVADLPIQPTVVLDSQHAALRWERVARRWNYKHGGAYFWFGHPMMIAILGAPAKEPPP